MRRDDDLLLNDAVKSMKADGPDSAEVTASGRLVAQRLHIDFLGEPDAATVNWSTPAMERGFRWQPRRLGFALAPVLALVVCTVFLYRIYWEVPPGVRAEVQSIDGTAYRISDQGDHPLTAGDKLAEGELLRTSGGAHAVLRLADGSTVEIKERSVLGVGARGRDMTVSLDYGAVIVQAAKRDSGHLYVNTKDCRVAVTGTVFSVISGIKGSRVAVLQGSVHVLHAGVDSVIQAGDQLATSDRLVPATVEGEISWSHDRGKYANLLAQFSLLQHRIERIPFPQARFTSYLLQRVPADTLLYFSIPNLGDFLSEANTIFSDQLKESPALQQWWAGKHDKNSAQLDSMVGKIHEMSQYLGDEIVVIGVKRASDPGFAVIADVRRTGLDEFLKMQVPSAEAGLTVFDERSLDAAHIDSGKMPGGYAVIREHEAVFSNDLVLLKQVSAQLNAGTSGFAAGDFGQQISAAYQRGAGIILAADVHQMMAAKADFHPPLLHGNKAMESSGIEEIRYLIAEHREIDGQVANHLNLQFTGARQRVASWLAAPAPMGSLDYIGPHAAVVVAVLTKDPKDIADDILSMTDSGKSDRELSDAEDKLQINFRDDLASTLGGEFLLSLDGPVLPTPSWKALIEVHDSVRLEKTLERLTQSTRNMSEAKAAHQIAIESSMVGGQTFYALHDLASGNYVAHYTYSGGYMILAPSRALVMEALRTHATGDSLAQSTAFKALLPKDENDNYSALAYQNLSPVLTPLLSQFSGESAEAIRHLAQDARPTAICAWGKENRIEVASDSHLFGFDLLTLGALINSGNKHTTANVNE